MAKRLQSKKKKKKRGTQARPSPPPPSITPQPANGSPPGRFAASLRLKGGPRHIVLVVTEMPSAAMTRGEH
ncbi:hypothetical protein DAPPUDRAFT_265082 [Daphnia pulex]|uniref:Uncharacterized protein n=1 Tax=Daphnia pulex TaxID=6669 RepID=E9HSU6_DAPPU|nr:hypothetical protein DAPPUDRAFT_265082 [Daphnia pulex]|eukprot:EFX65176.1 hypothetical protein DAPPUDRAFT_265082 [Daphnia pulex]